VEVSGAPNFSIIRVRSIEAAALIFRVTLSLSKGVRPVVRQAHHER